MSQEFDSLARGDAAAAVRAAREELRAKEVANVESAAIYIFFKLHPEIVSCDANSGILLKEARSYGGVVNLALIELAFLKVGSRLIPTPPPVRQPTPDESRIAENSRLRSLTQDEIRKELKRLHPGYAIPQDVVSPELLAMTCKRDVLALSGAQLTKFMFRESDGSKRRANCARIDQLLQN
jgi:hypothetical protein